MVSVRGSAPASLPVDPLWPNVDYVRHPRAGRAPGHRELRCSVTFDWSPLPRESAVKYVPVSLAPRTRNKRQPVPNLEFALIGALQATVPGDGRLVDEPPLFLGGGGGGAVLLTPTSAGATVTLTSRLASDIPTGTLRNVRTPSGPSRVLSSMGAMAWLRTWMLCSFHDELPRPRCRALPNSGLPRR